ncbi:MAG: hypothetical protein JSS61_02080 [Verrucomicrobia bacterium]|nr:hypothetical protein [Verrucomicrobiota bacterium]
MSNSAQVNASAGAIQQLIDREIAFRNQLAARPFVEDRATARENDQLRESVSALTQQLSSGALKIQELTHQLEQAQQQVSRLEQETSLESEIQQARAQCAELENQLETAQQQVAQLTQELSEARALGIELTRAKSVKKQLKEQSAEKDSRIAELERELHNLPIAHEEKIKELNKSILKTIANDNKKSRELNQKTKECEQLKKAIEGKDSQIEQMQASIEELRQEIEQLKEGKALFTKSAGALFTADSDANLNREERSSSPPPSSFVSPSLLDSPAQ